LPPGVGATADPDALGTGVVPAAELLLVGAGAEAEALGIGGFAVLATGLVTAGDSLGFAEAGPATLAGALGACEALAELCPVGDVKLGAAAVWVTLGVGTAEGVAVPSRGVSTPS
jgi:hypothetical protein